MVSFYLGLLSVGRGNSNYDPSRRALVGLPKLRREGMMSNIYKASSRRWRRRGIVST